MIHSAGIIPFRENNNGVLEFFVGHPGGIDTEYWAYMKGQVKSGEDLIHAALREFSEESGLNVEWITADRLIPVGTVLQNKGKIVTAYGIWWPDIDPNECFSNFVCDTNIPEIDRYAWLTLEELKPLTHHTHVRFYEDISRMWRARSE